MNRAGYISSARPLCPSHIYVYDHLYRLQFYKQRISESISNLMKAIMGID